MKVEMGQAAFITGAAGGIGRALAVAVASRGVQVTVLDLKTEMGEETVALVEEQHAKISYKPTSSPSAIFVHCDVTKPDELAAAFARHHEVFGRLDICINNAGIVEPMSNAGADWRRVIDVNLVAVIEGTSKAIQAMKDQGGLVLNVASAAGIIPMPYMPVYSASKAGAAMFTRAIGQIGMGIRVNAICAEYVETPLLDDMPADRMDFLRENLGFVKMERVLAAAFSLLDDESMTGECVWVPINRPTQIWPDEETKAKYTALKKDGTVFTGIF